jgi:Flp pilus assembly pilin Flp
MGSGTRSEYSAEAVCFHGLGFGVTGEARRVKHFLRNLWTEQDGQDVAEYSVMLAVVLVIVIGTVRLIGSNASNIFSQVGSAIQ